jgi:hypothetical protein
MRFSVLKALHKVVFPVLCGAQEANEQTKSASGNKRVFLVFFIMGVSFQKKATGFHLAYAKEALYQNLRLYSKGSLNGEIVISKQKTYTFRHCSFYHIGNGRREICHFQRAPGGAADRD